MLTLEQAPDLFKVLKQELTAKGLVSLIRLHLPLARGIARKYARRKERGHDADEYIAVSFLAVVEAVHNAFKYMTHDNIVPYVVVYVKRALLKHYREDRIVPIPTHMQDRFFKLGYLLRIEVRPLEPDDVGIIHNNDLLDALIELLPDLVHRQILTLRLQYHTDKAIAILLNMEVKEARRIRNEIKKILIDLLEDDD